MKTLQQFIGKNKGLIIYVFLSIIIGFYIYFNLFGFILGLVDTANEAKIQIASKIEFLNLGLFITINILLIILNIIKKINIKKLYIFLGSYSLLYIILINLIRLYY